MSMNTAVKDTATSRTELQTQPTRDANNAATVGEPTLPVHRFTTEDYLSIIEAGLLGEGDKVELIDGMISDMSPQGPEHSGDLIAYIDLFLPVKDRCHFAVQSTMPFGEGRVLDPDFVVLRPRDDRYRRAYAKPEDVLLLIEVASTSQVRDREVKPPICAAAGVVRRCGRRSSRAGPGAGWPGGARCGSRRSTPAPSMNAGAGTPSLTAVSDDLAASCLACRAGRFLEERIEHEVLGSLGSLS